MKKRFLSLTLALLTLLSLLTAFALPASAEEEYIHDESGLLSSSEIETVREKLRNVSEKYDCPVVIYVYNNTPDGSHYQSYADRLANSYSDVIMLFICFNKGMGLGRKYEIEVRGKGDAAVMKDSERGYDLIENNTVELMKEDDFFGAYKAFAEYSDKTLDAYVNDKKLREDYPWRRNIIITVIVALIVGLIYISKLKKQLKSVELQRGAANYVKDGSMNVTIQKDIYLYSTVTRTARPKNTSSGGGGGSRSVGGGHSRGGSF